MRKEPMSSTKLLESKMRELGRQNDRADESTFVPDLLEWMGAAFGDAVERAKAQPLRLGRAQLEDLIRALPAAIYATDAAGRITFYNQAAAEMWGCRPELGKSEFCGSWKLYWPDGRPLPHGQCPMALALKEQRVVRGMEAVAERPDGSLVHFVSYPTPLYDASGILIGAVNMMIDISDRKRADLHAQQLASIVESSDDAIVSKDLEGIITSWNRGAERLFGYAAKEVVGKPVTILIPADRQDEEPEILERIRRGERIAHYDTIRCRKDGSLINISLTVSPLKDADGKITGASKIARDITERKRAQEQQKLLVNEMKHRIKNSLATVQAIATQTLNQHAKERDAFVARLHALANAHDLLTSETWEKAPLHAIVTRALEPFQEQRRDRMTVDGPTDLFLDSTNSVMVAMVVHELATNAIKYGALSNGSGRVSVAWKQHSQPNFVTLIWQESGGPEVGPPKQKGFGSHLIERAFGGQLGQAQLVFSPNGLCCILEVGFQNAAQ
jgi:two-component system, chemotaxis family, CheB/CheR fusion protein